MPLHATLSRWHRALHGEHWLPQWPLALLLAWGGVQLLQVDMGTGWSPLLAGVVSGREVLEPAMLPLLLIGAGMLIIALGLLLRSRVAWIMALLLTVTATVALMLGHRAAGPLLPAYFVALSGLLSWARNHFDRSSLAASTLFALTSVVMLLLYATFGAYYLGADFHPTIDDLTTAVYFAIVTTSTVGYGDITPQTADARLFSVSVIVLGVAVFATSLTAVVAPLVTRSLQRIVNRDFRHMRRENHFVVLGDTSLAVNTWQELVKRDQPVTRVVQEAIDAPPEGTDVIVGDPGSVEVLRRAGVERAAAVLAMLDDDSDNAFAVLAVRELKSSARTVVAVNDAAHLERIRLVQPDVVIAPQILGGELAAMIACGEEITSDVVMQRLVQRPGNPTGATG